MEEFKKTYSLLRPHQKRLFSFLMLLALVTSLLESSGVGLIFLFISSVGDPPSLAKWPVLGDHYEAISRNLPHFFIFSALVIGLFYILKNVFLAFSIYLQQYMNHSIAADLQIRLLKTYLHAPYMMHFQRNSAELLRNVTENAAALPELILRSVVNIATEGAVAFFLLIILIVAEPVVAFTGLAVIGSVMTLMHLYLRNRYLAWGILRSEIRMKTLQQIQQSIANVKDIKILGCEDYFCDGYARIRGQQTRVDCAASTLGELPRLSMETLLIWAMVLSIVIIVLEGKDWSSLVATLGLYGYSGFRLLPSLNRIMLFLHNLKFGRASVDFVYGDLMSYPISGQAVDNGESAAPVVLNNQISLVDLSYTYPQADKPALRNVNLTIKRGMSLGIVGASGAGKSTLVDIVLGLLDPQSGHVLIDDLDVTRNARARQKVFGYVPQTIVLTDDSLKRNIAFGIPDDQIDIERVWKAVRMALLEDVVLALPEGLEASVGERGILLSGGQRQRVGIARALYHDPEVLVLDEATSALDLRTEQEISKALDLIGQQKTLLIIAHRLSTVKRCDELIFMRDGSICARGPFDALFDKSSEFRELVKLSGMSRNGYIGE